MFFAMCVSLLLFLQTVMLVNFSSAEHISNAIPTQNPFLVDRPMGKPSYQIVSVTKSTDVEKQKYTVVIRAPLKTTMDTHENDRHFSAWRGNSEWQLVSADSGGNSAIYQAVVKASLNSFLIPPVWLITENESLDLRLSPFVRIEKQTKFKFNDCQFQIEKQNTPESTFYKITVRSCNCRRGFEGSVGNMTSSGFEETAGLSPSYFFPVHMYGGRMTDDQTSTIFINRTALNKDGVHIKSLKFLIKRDQDDIDTDFFQRSQYGYSLV